MQRFKNNKWWKR